VVDSCRAVLADPDGHERFSAAHALVNLASRYEVLPQEISDLLGAAARDSDPEIARFVSDALYQLEMRARRLAEQPPETRPEAELQELAKQRELEEIAVVLNDPRSGERYRAAHSLTELALSYKVLPDEVLELLVRTRRDDDLEIARLAETMLARMKVGRWTRRSYGSPSRRMTNQPCRRQATTRLKSCPILTPICVTTRSRTSWRSRPRMAGVSIRRF